MDNKSKLRVVSIMMGATVKRDRLFCIEILNEVIADLKEIDADSDSESDSDYGCLDSDQDVK